MTMGHEDALPPPIHRSPRAALERQRALGEAWFDDDDLGEAAPVVPRNRSASMESASSLQARSRPNPLALHPVARAFCETSSTSAATDFSHQSFSHPFWDELKPFQVEGPGSQQLVTPPVPHRSPARLKSYRANKRLPPHLRRRTSLETIASVTTNQSCTSDEDEPDPPEASAPSPYLFTPEDHWTTTPIPSDIHSLASPMRTASLTSHKSLDPAVTLVNPWDSAPKSPKSLFQKMTGRKSSEPTSIPDQLMIESKISFDRTSHRSSLSGSSQSLVMKGPVNTGLLNTERSPSGSSSEWSASNFDMSALSEAEIKKCKKKGINPSLFAEMKAARKGKWSSPIAGNTFL